MLLLNVLMLYVSSSRRTTRGVVLCGLLAALRRSIKIVLDNEIYRAKKPKIPEKFPPTTFYL